MSTETPPAPESAPTPAAEGEPQEASAAKNSHPLFALLRRTMRIGLRLILPAWIVGQVFRDTTLLTALCFYIPSPLVVLLLLGKGVWNCRKPRQAIRPLLWMLLPLMATLFQENHWGHRALPTGGIKTQRLVHWNIYGSYFGLTNILNTIEELDPDLIVLSEVPGVISNQKFQKRYPDDYSIRRVGGMVIIARGRLTQETISPLPHGTVGLFSWNNQGKQRRILIADLPSSILIARDPLLRELNQRLKQHQPDLVVGDLNSPRLSTQLCRLPRGYRHAYDVIGSGWSYTWPVRWPMESPFRWHLESVLIAPLWSLDHCIIGPNVKPLRYELQSTRYSDHRLQILEFEN